MLVCSVALAGCVGVPVEELLASTAIVAEFQRENGALAEAARFSAGRAGEAPPGGWDPFIVSPFSTSTEYRLVESDLSVVLISFHGDVTRLDFVERTTLRLYKALSGEVLPYAMLMYIWSSGAPVGTIAPNNYTDKIQMIVVDSGSDRIGEWHEFRRNVLEDYRLAFGEEPWDIVAVGVMTDADKTRQKARAQYGDITFRPAQ